MLLTCENCETIFRIESAQLKAPNQKVRCSVCKYVWAPDVDDNAPTDPQFVKDSFLVLRMPMLICAIVIFVVSVMSFNRGVISAYVPSTIGLFDMTGLEIRPEIDQLEVRDLKANVSGDTLRISGLLANKSQFRAHAAPLQVTVSDKDGVVILTKRLLPNDAFITGNGTTDFFAQMTIDETAQAEVRVAPLAMRLTPQGESAAN